MQRDLEALELVCKHYDAFYSKDALRKEKNRVRALQLVLCRNLNPEPSDHLPAGVNLWPVIFCLPVR